MSFAEITEQKEVNLPERDLSILEEFFSNHTKEIFQEVGEDHEEWYILLEDSSNKKEVPQQKKNFFSTFFTNLFKK